VRAHAPGFAEYAMPVGIPDSGGRWPYDLPRIELVAEGVIAGDVVDGRGAPIAGARVAKDHVPTWLVVGTNPEGVALTDAKGRFVLRQLSEGTVALEAYAPDLGRTRVDGVRVTAGRTTEDVRIVLAVATDAQTAARANAAEGLTSGATGSLAVTLGETSAPTELVFVSVVEGSEAERAGIAPGDVLVAVDDVPVHTMEEARARLNGPVANDVVVRVRRGEEVLSLRAAREPVRR
jgi:C-terminal processing protease CtpA/Prc